MILLLWVIKMKKRFLLNLLLIFSLTSCDLLDQLKSTLDSSEGQPNSESSNKETSIPEKDSSSIIKNPYEVDEQIWAEELGFKSCINATIDFSFQYSVNTGEVEKNQVKYEIDNESILASQELDVFGDGNIQTVKQFIDISDYSVLKMYGFGQSNGELKKICMTQNSFAENEEEAKKVLIEYFETLMISSVGHVLLKEQFNIATFDGSDYLIDGANIPYYAVSTFNYSVNDAIIKYHFEDNKLVSINYEEKVNKDNKISILISNRGTTKTEYDATGVCMHENAYVSSSASSSAHYIECSKCNMSICLQAHTFEEEICKYCDYEHKVIDYSQYDVEYLNFKGYPKNAIKVYKDKKTHQIAKVVIDGMKSFGYDYEKLVFTYVMYGYNVYITEESFSTTTKKTTTYSFYTFDDKKLLQQLTFFE